MSSIVIGVAGGSGSGKTTVVRRIVDSSGTEHVTVLDHDRYYRDRNDLRFEERAALNYDHPDALETDSGPAPARRCGPAGRSTCRRTTSRATRGCVRPKRPHRGGRSSSKASWSSSTPALRALMDIKVFVDTDADTRFIRRLGRDVAERGRTMESVIDQYQSTVKPMHLEFVEPSKRYADIIMPQGGHNTVAVDLLADAGPQRHRQGFDI